MRDFINQLMLKLSAALSTCNRDGNELLGNAKIVLLAIQP